MTGWDAVLAPRVKCVRRNNYLRATSKSVPACFVAIPRASRTVLPSQQSKRWKNWLVLLSAPCINSSAMAKNLRNYRTCSSENRRMILVGDALEGCPVSSQVAAGVEQGEGFGQEADSSFGPKDDDSVVLSGRVAWQYGLSRPSCEAPVHSPSWNRRFPLSSLDRDLSKSMRMCPV